jgi:molybdate transport system substrate-binding protein
MGGSNRARDSITIDGVRCDGPSWRRSSTPDPMSRVTFLHSKAARAGVRWASDWVLFACIAALMALASVAKADEVQVAVAANFAAPMAKIAAAFTEKTGDKVQLAVGSTGKFYAQIRNGAPFEILLAADSRTPERLEDDGMSVQGQRFTYATGRLVLYSTHPGLVDDQGAVLKSTRFQYLALANPQTAPYGAAAVEVLKGMGIWESIQGRIVQGDSIAQAYEFVATGNADLGFVALSQLQTPEGLKSGSSWLVPRSFHRPIRQDAILLNAGANRPAARALFAFLRSEEAKAVIRSYGYEL